MAEGGDESMYNDDLPIPAEYRTVLVEGVPPEFTAGYLEIYFASPKIGGGDVESITVNNRGGATVVFAKYETVETILEYSKHGTHTFSGHDLRVYPPDLNDWQYEGAGAILVDGLSSDTKKDMVHWYFERNGGNIERIEVYPRSGKAVIWYSNARDAQSVLERGPLTLQDRQLTVSPFVQEPMVKIKGIDDKISQDALALFFENTKMSSGGEIKSINVYHAMGMAIITFEDQEVADRVVEKSEFTFADSYCLKAEYYYGLEPKDIMAKNKMQKNLPVEMEYCRVSSDDDFSTEEESDLESFTIEVSGVKPETLQDTVKQYFSSCKKSGGGKIETISHDDDDKYIITFKDSETVVRVLERETHKLNGAKLNVSLMQSVGGGEEFTGDAELDKVYILGLNEKTTSQELELHLEEDADWEVDNITYGLDPSVALVSFKERLDYKKLQKALSKRPLRSCRLSVARVPESTSLQVFNIGTISEDGLTAYFGNRRLSQGYGDVEVTINSDQGYAIVTFDNSEILRNVLEKSPHRYDGQMLSLRTYRERLGIIPVDHDTSQPYVQIPSNCMVSNLDTNIIQYFKATPKATNELNEEMVKYHSKIDWNHESDTELHVNCTLQKDDKDVTCLKKNWDAKTKGAILSLISSIGVEKRECLKKIWTDVCREVNIIREADQDVAIIERDDEAAFYIVGPKEAASGIHHQVDQLCKEFEQNLEHIETKIKLNALEKALLEKTDILGSCENGRPKLKITLIDESLELRGPARDLVDAQREINSFLRNMDKRTLKKSKAQLRFISKVQEEDEDPLEAILTQLNAIIHLKDDDMILFGPGEELDKCEEILENNIKEALIEVTSEEQTALRSDVWKQFMKDLFKHISGVLYLAILPENTSINLVANQKDFHFALEEIKTHIRRNAVKKEFVEMDEATSKLIGRWMQDDLKSIEEDFKEYSIKIVQQDDSFCVKGTPDGLTPAKLRLENLQKKVITDNHIVTTPGMPHYFTQQEAGKYFIKAQEEKYQVVIHHEDPRGIKEVARETKKQIRQPISSKLEEVIYAGVKIKAIVADMTSLRVDCIVNAANGQLQHAGTLAKAIADKGGPTIQDESNRYVRRYGPVVEGHAVMTGSGNLTCRNLIHAVGPVWRGGRSSEAEILYECVFSHILQKAVEENFSSIAIPAISGGTFGMPITVSTSMIVDAIKDFLDETTDKGALSEIRLVDTAPERVQEFAKVMKKKFKVPRSTRDVKKDILMQSTQTKSFARKGTNELETNEGMVVTIKKGTIAQEKVDMILNTATPELNLNAGALSKSILQAAGPSIQSEVSQTCPNGLQLGEHVTSSGGNLKVKKIFHAVLCRWDQGTGSAKQAPNKLIFDFLKFASDNEYTSVALPAMGTGGLGFPRNLIADAMFNEVIEFSRKCPDTSVKDVRFVLFDQDKQTIDVFEDHLSKLTNSPSDLHASKNVMDKQGTKVKAASRRKIFNPSDSLEIDGGTPEPFEFVEPRQGAQARGAAAGGDIQIGSICLQVAQGDITQETTDAIVNGTNARLDNSQGSVSTAIARAAGRRYTEECQLTGAIGYNGVAVTGAGDLHVKNVFNIDVIELNSNNTWKGGISKCLQEAERMGLTSLSFPALGTGNLGIDPGTMAVHLMEGIADFCRKNQNSSINLVRVVIYESSMVSTYVEQMDKATKPGSSIWGMVRGFARSVGSSIGLLSSRAKEDRTVLQKPVAYSVPVESVSLTFVIYGLKQEKINAVKREMDRCCELESANILISAYEYSDVIKTLDEKQVWRLEQIGHKLGVRVTVDRGHKLGKIQLLGLTRVVYQVESQVKEVLHKIKAEQMENYEAWMLEQFVQWEYEEFHGQFLPYPTEINTLLEKAYNKNKHSEQWQEKEPDGRLKTFVVNFKNLTEGEGRKVKKVNRRRLDTGTGVTLELPKNWAPMNNTSAYELVDIKPGDSEYTEVGIEFTKTSTAQIIKIQRLQNKYQYRRYMVHKEDMEARKPKTVPYERRLWHGTSPDTINAINTNGFNRSYCGKNATKFGLGVYFARDASYSVNYSPPDTSGQKQMYFARVLTGDYAIGDTTMKIPPSKNDSKNPSLHYDTTVNNVNDPSIFVIYYDTQAYPEYVVTFK